MGEEGLAESCAETWEGLNCSAFSVIGRVPVSRESEHHKGREGL